MQNRGAARVVKLFGRLWPRLGCPVIAQVADTHPEEAHATARHLSRAKGLAGLELLLSPYAQADDLFDLVEAIRPVWDLPIWVKLPLDGVVELAYAGAEAGADGLVVGQPSQGSAFHPNGAAITGSLYGPLTFAPMLNALLQVARLDLGLPLIACGGLHTPEQIRQVLTVGASAVQLDSLVWVESGMVGQIADMMRDA
jgi:dihydroorotate dehydrogenase